jgi:hypothetical protein
MTDDLTIHPSLWHAVQRGEATMFSPMALSDLRRVLLALERRGRWIQRMEQRAELDQERLDVLRGVVRQQLAELAKYSDAYRAVVDERDSARRERDAAMVARDQARAEMAVTEEQVEVLLGQRAGVPA